MINSGGGLSAAWTEARGWVQARVTGRKYTLPNKRRPDTLVARSTNGVASRYYQLKSGHALTGQYLKWTTNQLAQRRVWVVWAQDADPRAPLQPAPFKIRDLFADDAERCSKSIVYLLSTSGVGRRIPDFGAGRRRGEERVPGAERGDGWGWGRSWGAEGV